jgi:uncharacterized membrane protein
MMRRAPRWLAVLLVALSTFASAAAFARSGSSFGGRQGFRSGGGITAPSPGYSGGGYGSPYSGGYGYAPRSHFFFLPGFGGYGYGGGFGLFGSLAALLVVGLVVGAVARAVRASRGIGSRAQAGYGYDDAYGDGYASTVTDRAYLYRLQLALGRSARGIQDRLGEFAAQGNTETEAGLVALLQQTALELLREKDAIRYLGTEARGPLSLTNAETAMNGMALAERGRYQVERIRNAAGQVSRTTTAPVEGKEALELIVVTLLVATRTPLDKFGLSSGASAQEVDALLTELGGVSPDALLGLEVIWTPADPNDSMTETDVMTTYPELRSL